MKIVDSHCHLDFDKFDEDFVDVIERAKKSGVSKILTICTKKEQLIKNINICNRNKFIFFAYGMHPLNIGKEEIKISEIDKKLVELNNLREQLSHLASSCKGNHRPDCPILEALSKNT